MHVSRRHLLLRIELVNTSRRIVAVDLGSRNGTTVERWEQKTFLPPKPVPPEKDLYLGSKDRLVLGDAVNLRLSGKHYVRAGDTPEDDAAGPAQVDVPYWAAGDDPGSTVVLDIAGVTRTAGTAGTEGVIEGAENAEAGAPRSDVAPASTDLPARRVKLTRLAG
jgi:pSer/pThr/pTyr-binding forkhead associated (FHA) protein